MISGDSKGVINKHMWLTPLQVLERTSTDSALHGFFYWKCMEKIVTAFEQKNFILHKEILGRKFSNSGICLRGHLFRKTTSLE